MFATRVPFSVAAGVLCSMSIFVALARFVSVPFDAPPLTKARKIDFTPKLVLTSIEPLPRQPAPTARPPRAGVL
jgi:hypothetical protein